MNNVYLLLGSNLSDPAMQLEKAAGLLAADIGAIVNKSSVYLTAPWGKHDQPDFLNQVLEVKTILSAAEVLKNILAIETRMGRRRAEKNASRVIDIDILFYDNEVIHRQNLIIPHPAIPDRRFVLIPMNELSPSFTHPILHKTIHQLLLECDDKLDVKRF